MNRSKAPGGADDGSAALSSPARVAASHALAEDPVGPVSGLRAHDLSHIFAIGDLHRTASLGQDTSVSLPSLLDVIREITEAFRREDVAFALCGTLALAFYTRARVTADLEFVSLAAQRELITRALDALGLRVVDDRTPDCLGFVAAHGTVGISVLLGTAAPETCAVADPLPADCVGVPLPVIRSEDLLWLYCRSRDRQHGADAISLLRSEQTHVPDLRRRLAQAGDTAAGHQLSLLQLRAQYEAIQGDYSAAVERRRAARQGLPRTVALRVPAAPPDPESDPERPSPYTPWSSPL